MRKSAGNCAGCRVEYVMTVVWRACFVPKSGRGAGRCGLVAVRCVHALFINALLLARRCTHNQAFLQPHPPSASPTRAVSIPGPHSVHAPLHDGLPCHSRMREFALLGAQWCKPASRVSGTSWNKCMTLEGCAGGSVASSGQQRALPELIPRRRPCTTQEFAWTACCMCRVTDAAAC